MKPIIQDLIKEGMVISTLSPFNSPIWPVLKSGKNGWLLMMAHHNFNVVGILLRTRKVKVLVTQSYPTLWDSMDCSLPAFYLHGILQARILEWRPWPRGQTWVSGTAGSFLAVWAIRESPLRPLYQYYWNELLFSAKSFYSYSSYIYVLDPFWFRMDHMGWDRDPTLFFCMWVSSCQHYLLKTNSLPTEWSWHPCQKSVHHKCMNHRQ